ncbi:MAG: TIGR04282 family arsenosugar biosynthesis glycosyltransferase [Candidatus Eisenbacteria bacterium]|nr:TIGR04282 family arsenosugar biosynthesis glycosyltransferase [Candidatus Eisenbacteria bacterium]
MDRIGIFARHPVAGRVKTRLSPALPAELAARLYAAMLEDTLAAARGAELDRTLWWADDGPARGDAGLAERRQEGPDLGERMTAAMNAMLVSPIDRAVIVGSDCPALAVEHFAAAFAAMDGADVVLGPSEDGGYWLVGMRRRTAVAIFRNIQWSSPTTLTDTLAQAKRAGLPVRTLPTLPDVDTPDDLAGLVAALAAGRRESCGPATREALREMGLVP